MNRVTDKPETCFPYFQVADDFEYLHLQLDA